MKELIKVIWERENPVVLARDLHEFLEVNTRFNDWFPRMCEYGFIEGQDFYSFLSESTGGRPAQDAMLNIDMAKEICMLQRNEKGKMARQYFVELEKEWNSPEKVMARALQFAQKELRTLRPKGKYFDALVERGTNINFRDTAKELHIGQKQFINFLFENGFIYRDAKGKLKPYMQHVDEGLFVIKEGYSKHSKWSGNQTLTTPKGRETFRLLLER